MKEYVEYMKKYKEIYVKNMKEYVENNYEEVIIENMKEYEEICLRDILDLALPCRLWDLKKVQGLHPYRL